jgi:hypothetical protein
MTLALVRETAGKPADIPEGVEITRRVSPSGEGSFLFVLNHTLETKTVSGLNTGKPLLGKDTAETGEGFSIGPLGAEIFKRGE